MSDADPRTAILDSQRVQPLRPPDDRRRQIGPRAKIHHRWTLHHGERMRALRELVPNPITGEPGVSQWQLSQLSRVHPSTIARMERLPTFDGVTLGTLLCIVRALGCRLGELVGNVVGEESVPAPAPTRAEGDQVLAPPADH